MTEDIFIKDVRVNGDPSLVPVPRITSYAQLQQHFKIEVDRRLGHDAVKNGQKYWRLVGFEVRVGAATAIPQVKMANGNPAAGILVFWHWPDAPKLPDSIAPKYFPNGVAGFTDTNGVVGFGFGGGSVTGPSGGPHNIWISADPPGGERIGSDMARKLGWIGSTDHLFANPIFQATTKGEGGAVEPPPVTAGDTIELRVGGQTVYRGVIKVTVEQDNG